MAVCDTMKTYDLAVVGEIYVDHVLTGFTTWPQPGEEMLAQDYVREVGGGAAITACALARLGRSASLIGAIGETDASWIEHRLAEFSVSSDGLRRGSGRTGLTVSISSQVDRTFFTYLGENVRLEEQLAGHGLLDQMAQARHVHFAMPITARLAEKLLGALNAASCSTSLDVGHQAAWLQDAANLRTCSSVDYLLPNEREAHIICGGDAYDYLAFTRENRWPNGVVKLGAEGAMMRCGDATIRASCPAVRTVDTTGAGDAFNAGFIDALLDGKGSGECLRRGCVCGSLSTRAAGALRGLPTRSEFEKCLQETYG